MLRNSKKYLCFFTALILLTVQFGGLAKAEEKKGGFLDSVGGFLGDAWSGIESTAGDAAEWASGAANDVGEWATGAANDVGEWATGAYEDAGRWLEGAAGDVSVWAEGAYNSTIQWAGDAAVWAGDTASAAGKWLADTATGAWDWTKGAANDTWIWARVTAEDAWNVTSTAVSGTWDSVFGKADDSEGPRHLCVSSPLFMATEIIQSDTDESGNVVECFKYDSEYDVTLIATARAEDIMPPSVGEIQFSDLVASCYDTIAYVDQNVDGVGVRAMAQELRFKAVFDSIPKFGRALGVWTDHYIVAFIITSDVAFESEEVDVEELKDTDAVFDLWTETLSIYETKKAEFEADVDDTGTAAGNLTASNVKTANRLFDEVRFHSPKGGRGFAAEQANTLADNLKGIFKGQRARIVGDDNAKDGADRKLTDRYGNVGLIQSKYYSTARDSINACFNDNGVFRYIDSDGQPMMVEVASDQYDDAVAIMRQCIKDGKIPGVTDPDQANNIVKKGTVTYKQACRIAKAGTIESLKYDSVNACVESAYSFGISSVVQFAVSMWNGEELKTALKLSVYTGLKVGGTSFVVSVLSSQLSKAGLNSLLVSSSEAVVKLMGPKAAAVFVNAFRTGGNIYGAAAMRSAAKLLRGNAITAAVSLVILTVPDVIEIFRGRISAKQLMKNVAQTGGGIAGGLGGWYGGAALGSLILPGVGTVIGGIVGSVGGGYIVQLLTGKVADLFAEDDADEMIDIISLEFESMAEEYLLNEEEVGTVVEKLNQTIDANMLKDMFASSSREVYAREVILRPIFNEIAENRTVIEIPTEEEYQEELIDVMEEIYDEEEAMEEAA